jgi:signal peptidase II
VPPPDAGSPVNPPPHPGVLPEPASVPSPRSRIQRTLAYRRLWLVGMTVFIVDQLTKEAIAERLAFPTFGPPHHIEIIPGFFNLVHVGNTGAAWSMFSGKGTMLALIAAVTLVAIFFFRRHLGLRHPFAQTCFGMLCGGTVGNLVDRIRHGHVIDFLDFHFGRYIYPTFNVADMGIVLGVFGYILWSLRQPEGSAGH